MALVLLLVLLTRVLQVLLDLVVSWDKAVWISYLGVGGILTLIGLFIMSKRHSTSS